MKSKKPRFAAKILALVLSLLMLLGACPIVLAADGDIVIKWPTAEKEIEIGQKYYEAGLVGGESAIPGKFEYASLTAKPSRPNTYSRPINFVPDDTSIAPISGTVEVTAVKSQHVELVGGVPTASAPIKAGQKLSDCIINEPSDIKLSSHGSKYPCNAVWKEPDKIMEQPGEYTEIILCNPTTSLMNSLTAVEVEATVIVESNADDSVVVLELPKASDIMIGQTLSESVLTGGVIAKGGEPVPGTFAWKSPDTVLNDPVTFDLPVIFTPTDSTVFESIEINVPVTVNKPKMEITWPTLRGHYKVNGVVRDCVTFEGGSCTVPGKFEFDGAHYLDKIPATMGESMKVYIKFVPDNKKLYDEVYNSFMVTFDPADPDCQVGYFISNDYKEYDITCRIASPQNWDMHTGKYYLILDGKRFELDKPTQTAYYKYTDLAAGEHTIQAVYEAGENDVYSDGKSDIKTFTVATFYKVNVTDCTGATTLEYLPGRTVSVTAPIHDKPYYDFTGWTAEGVELTEEEAAKQSVSFTMPEGEVNLTANYKFNFKNFVKYVFEQIGVKLGALITAGIEWIKGLLP